MGGERALRRRRAVAEQGVYRDGNLALRLVQHDREEYDRYYNVFANPTLWFIHHYLWSLALEPSVDRNVRLAWEAGYVPVNERFADAAAAELAGAGPRPLVMVHDYQLFMVPGSCAHASPGRSSTTSPTSRGRSRTTGACFPPTSAPPSTSRCWRAT